MNYDNYTDKAVALLSQLISTPSVSRDEKTAADIMQKHIGEMGLDPRRDANNVWVICHDFDEAKPTILLNAHIDTVKPAATWTRDPFKPEVFDGRLYGLGSNDCGGGLVSLLQVFDILNSRERSYNLVYLASAEEEVSGKDGFEPKGFIPIDTQRLTTGCSGSILDELRRTERARHSLLRCFCRYESTYSLR